MFTTFLLRAHEFVASGSQVSCGASTGCDTGLPVVSASSTQVQQILQIVFGILSALAVLMTVIAGFRYVIAQGNPQEITKAKNTIIYSLVGLVVALTAEAIVTFVLGSLT
jgi:hypothetical protein